MMSGGFMGPLREPPCEISAAKVVIDTFEAQAKKANQTFESDFVAEINIENYFHDATKRLSKLEGADPQKMGECVGILYATAARADGYRDGILQNLFSLNDLDGYIPPSERNWKTSLAAVPYNLGLTLGLGPILFGVTGNIESWQHP